MISTPFFIVHGDTCWLGYGRTAGCGRSSSFVSAGCRSTLASNPINPSGEISTGLISISLIHGCSVTNWLNFTSNASSGAICTSPFSSQAKQLFKHPGLFHHAPR